MIGQLKLDDVNYQTASFENLVKSVQPAEKIVLLDEYTKEYSYVALLDNIKDCEIQGRMDRRMIKSLRVTMKEIGSPHALNVKLLGTMIKEFQKGNKSKSNKRQPTKNDFTKKKEYNGFKTSAEHIIEMLLCSRTCQKICDSESKVMDWKEEFLYKKCDVDSKERLGSKCNIYLKGLKNTDDQLSYITRQLQTAIETKRIRHQITHTEVKSEGGVSNSSTNSADPTRN